MTPRASAIVARLIGYGAVVLGVAIIIAGLDYRLSIGPIGAAPPAGDADRERINLAFWIIFLGGCVGLLGPSLAYVLTRTIWKRPDGAAARVGWSWTLLGLAWPLAYAAIRLWLLWPLNLDCTELVIFCLAVAVSNAYLGLALYRPRDGLVAVFVVSMTAAHLACAWLCLWFSNSWTDGQWDPW